MPVLSVRETNRQVVPGAPWPASLAESANFRFNERPYLKQTNKRPRKQLRKMLIVDLWTPHSYLHMHVHCTQEYTHMNMYTHRLTHVHTYLHRNEHEHYTYTHRGKT